MGAVYSNAFEVAVWLGEYTEETRRAIEFIPCLFQSVSEPGWVDRRTGFWKKMQDTDFRNGLCHLTSFLTLPWWTRTWIIQEVSLAKNHPNIYHGAGKLSWPVLQRLIDCISPAEFHQMRYQRDRNPEKGFSEKTLTLFQRAAESNAMTLTYLHTGKKTGYSLSLLEALELSEKFLATDPRDKVFGLLRLFDSPSPLQVTYSLDYAIVNTTCIAQVLKECRNLKCLGWVTGHKSRDDTASRKLPSWVRDLTLNVRDLVLTRVAYRLQRGVLRPFYHAGGHEPLTLGLTLRFSENNKALILRGILMDGISAIGASAPSREEVFQHEKSLRSVLKDWKTLANDYCPRDFWRTIVMELDKIDIENQKMASRGFARRISGSGLCIPPRNEDEETFLIEILDKERGGIFSRRLMITSEGRLGIAPHVAKVGDRICVFTGGQLPCIIRPANNGYWQFIGERSGIILYLSGHY
ncbi:hypothetical protein ONS95_014384 [Cadophora gregata]|uniref:uncharacterized protein n=1 Tax=Cadophora gregata TaxID=51156 RepID=UPI0026DA7BDE|nr:uncharacterized protein ONS95_014384 [Cadophora gregata]KAK0112645.1 hypothetical protein ONS95_014384 [Cadophora gregata]